MTSESFRSGGAVVSRRNSVGVTVVPDRHHRHGRRNSVGAAPSSYSKKNVDAEVDIVFQPPPETTSPTESKNVFRISPNKKDTLPCQDRRRQSICEEDLFKFVEEEEEEDQNDRITQIPRQQRRNSCVSINDCRRSPRHQSRKLKDCQQMSSPEWDEKDEVLKEDRVPHHSTSRRSSCIQRSEEDFDCVSHTTNTTSSSRASSTSGGSGSCINSKVRRPEGRNCRRGSKRDVVVRSASSSSGLKPKKEMVHHSHSGSSKPPVSKERSISHSDTIMTSSSSSSPKRRQSGSRTLSKLKLGIGKLSSETMVVEPNISVATTDDDMEHSAKDFFDKYRRKNDDNDSGSGCVVVRKEVEPNIRNDDRDDAADNYFRKLKRQYGERILIGCSSIEDEDEEDEDEEEDEHDDEEDEHDDEDDEDEDEEEEEGEEGGRRRGGGLDFSSKVSKALRLIAKDGASASFYLDKGKKMQEESATSSRNKRRTSSSSSSNNRHGRST